MAHLLKERAGERADAGAEPGADAGDRRAQPGTRERTAGEPRCEARLQRRLRSDLRAAERTRTGEDRALHLQRHPRRILRGVELLDLSLQLLLREVLNVLPAGEHVLVGDILHVRQVPEALRVLIGLAEALLGDAGLLAVGLSQALRGLQRALLARLVVLHQERIG